MSKKSPTKRKKKVEDDGKGPNGVQRKHFRQAVDLAKLCKPEWEGKAHPKVGVVVVKNGKVIATAYRGEVGRGDHAEFIALERKLGGSSEVEGADLLTTLEPCTTRHHDKKPCVSWIKSRRIRKVWIATLDYNPSIAGLGELDLQKNGIRIGRFPDDLAIESIGDNSDFFDLIEKKQPKIDEAEQKAERILIIDILRDELDQLKRGSALLIDPYLKGNLKKKEDRMISKLLDETNAQRSKIQRVLQYAVAVEYDNALSWIQLGHALLEINQNGTALSAFRVATRIDSTSEGSWYGLAKSEAKLNKKVVNWPFGYPVDAIDTSPNQEKSESWLYLANDEGRLDLKLKYIARAIQSGNRTDEPWKRLQNYLNRPLPKSLDKQVQIANSWLILVFLFRELKDDEKADLCFKEKSRYVTEDGKKKLRYDSVTMLEEVFDD